MVALKKVAQYAIFSDDIHLDILIEDFLDEYPVLKDVPKPDTDDQRTLSVAAALVELLAIRNEQEPPEWSSTIGEMPEEFFIRHSAYESDWLRQKCLEESPEPLKKRRIYATGNFLTSA